MNLASIVKRTRHTNVGKDYIFETLIASKHRYAVAKKFHPIDAAHRYTGSVMIHGGWCGLNPI
jgi:hypothetical protein